MKKLILSLFAVLLAAFSASAQLDTLWWKSLTEEQQQAYIQEYLASLKPEPEKHVLKPQDGNVRLRIAVFGGSLSVNAESDAAKQIWADRLGAEVVTYGVGGAGFSLDQGYSIQKQVDQADVFDVYVLWASTNDFTNGRPCGSPEDKNLYSQCGGINYCIKTLKEKNPGAIICFFTSLPFYSEKASPSFATYIQAQKACCKIWDIPVLDQFSLPCFHKSSPEQFYMEDRLHLNEDGYRLIGPSQASFLERLTSLNLETEFWKARWISVPGTVNGAYGVYYFRKDVVLPAVPARYVVHVTGDNRYKLYVNQTLVSLGPAKGDARHWNYETVDLAPYLKAGSNVIAALVYHEGPSKTDSQISVSTGFLLQGEGKASGLYTDGSWKCMADTAYSPLTPIVSGYYVAGPGEKVDMGKTFPDWKKADADLSSWLPAREGPAGEPLNVNSSDQRDGHNLVPSPLPQMERTGFSLSEGFTVPAFTKKEIILDNKVLTNAYLHLSMSGGKGADVKIGYAESLYIPSPDQPQITEEMLAQIPPEYLYYALVPKVEGKGNRNETDGKIFIGREDELISGGAAGQEFTTLSWRTFRYVRVQVETAGEPLTVNAIDGIFTGYPFTLDSRLDTKDEELQKMLEIGWRTARLCAEETYMDCPYYERLQYLGDSRIQALVTLFNSKDHRLVRNFLRLADMSRNSDGITKSRYPTTLPQYIQPYALSYIYALHDYMMYGNDTDFVMDLLPGAEQIMLYFSRYQQEDGRLRNLPGWNFSDWVNDRPEWNYGAPLRGSDGCSINMDLQLLLAFRLMADMEKVRGNDWQAGQYLASAEKLAVAVKDAYWNPERSLFADRAEKDNYSQHGNALALLCGIVDDPKALAQKLLSEKDLAQCTIYYKFYLHEALVKAGLGDDYISWLDVWRENMAMGLTTWGEDANVFGTRSDCHAWGASPNIELYRTVLGISSDAVAFSHVRIEPHLGSIREIGGSIPHPAGAVSVSYKMKGNKLTAILDLPEGIEGDFVWKGKTYPLHSGKNSLKL